MRTSPLLRDRGRPGVAGMPAGGWRGGAMKWLMGVRQERMGDQEIARW